jgi:acyl carrier protein
MALPQPTDTARPPAPSMESRAGRLIAEAQAGFLRFKTGGDPADLDGVVMAMLRDHTPRRNSSALGDIKGGMRLTDDLGLDSLAVTEMVFFAEDLFAIRITNQEIAEVRTIDDLRLFIRRKVAASLKP